MNTSIKVRAHTNLALVKYWGKKDRTLFLPYNSSISMTLDAFYTDTQVTLLLPNQPSLFLLNGVEQKDSKVLSFASYLVNTLSKEKYSLKIDAVNHVPTGAGMASSSSGFSAITYALVKLLKPDLSLKEVSRLTRRGSGSSCRSIFGGFVLWNKGDSDETSYATPIDEHPSFDVATTFIVFKDSPKEISSREGMEICVQTSKTFKQWVDIAEEDILLIEKAIKENDFSELGSIAEVNCLAMHQTTIDATPSFSYFTPDTMHAIRIIRSLRQEGIECYFTIDAGPNIAVLSRKKDVGTIKKRFERDFPKAIAISTGFGEGVKVIE